MASNGERFMQLFVLFDLPTKTKRDRFNANRFRRELIKDGYQMLQFSIYTRLCKGEDTVEKHRKRLNKSLPPRGNIRVLQVTETQYSRMQILVGEAKKIEKIASNQLILF